MRQLSAKVRITLWFAVMMLIIDALVLTFIMVINGNVVTRDPESVLVKELNANVDRVKFDNQRFRFARRAAGRVHGGRAAAGQCRAAREVRCGGFLCL